MVITRISSATLVSCLDCGTVLKPRPGQEECPVCNSEFASIGDSSDTNE